MKSKLDILTFDIEEWFHIVDVPSAKNPEQWERLEVRIYKNVDRILELLEERKQKATFFCLGWIGKKYPDVIKKINSLGHEIGSHSNLHKPVYRMTPKEFKEDTEISIKILENITGKKVRMYRAPSFSITKEALWAFEILHELGIEIDSSIFPAKRAHGGFDLINIDGPFILEFSGIKIKEFPMNTYKVFGKSIVFSGGGYFRLLPYKLIKGFTEKSKYVMTYFHPRDFDPGQPVLDGLSTVRRFKSYYGLDSSFGKLKKLLSDFNFIDINAADKIIDWESAKKINIKEILQ